MSMCKGTVLTGNNFLQKEEGEEAAACDGCCEEAEEKSQPQSRELCSAAASP